jgi:hypothetical protein
MSGSCLTIERKPLAKVIQSKEIEQKSSKAKKIVR